MCIRDSPDTLHENLHFLLVQDAYYVPLIIQLLLVELIIDVLKLASLNTPDVLSNSFSMIGALILGDFAVQARWLVPEVLVYMAFVAIANYAQHSYEMGYATKLCRMLLLILIWLFDLWGFLAGIVGTLTLMATTKPLVGKGYLYPLIPFDGKKLKRLLHRVPISRDNSRRKKFPAPPCQFALNLHRMPRPVPAQSNAVAGDNSTKG